MISAKYSLEKAQFICNSFIDELGMITLNADIKAIIYYQEKDRFSIFWDKADNCILLKPVSKSEDFILYGTWKIEEQNKIYFSYSLISELNLKQSSVGVNYLKVEIQKDAISIKSQAEKSDNCIEMSNLKKYITLTNEQMKALNFKLYDDLDIYLDMKNGGILLKEHIDNKDNTLILQAVRKVDELSRIVLPVELRHHLDIEPIDELSIYTDEAEQAIIIVKS